jgi:hypothetical protein
MIFTSSPQSRSSLPKTKQKNSGYSSILTAW